MEKKKEKRETNSMRIQKSSPPPPQSGTFFSAVFENSFGPDSCDNLFHAAAPSLNVTVLLLPVCCRHAVERIYAWCLNTSGYLVVFFLGLPRCLPKQRE